MALLTSMRLWSPVRPPHAAGQAAECRKLGLGCTFTGFVLTARTVRSHRQCQACQSSALTLFGIQALVSDLQPHPAGRPQ